MWVHAEYFCSVNCHQGAIHGFCSTSWLLRLKLGWIRSCRFAPTRNYLTRVMHVRLLSMFHIRPKRKYSSERRNWHRICKPHILIIPTHHWKISSSSAGIHQYKCMIVVLSVIALAVFQALREQNHLVNLNFSLLAMIAWIFASLACCLLQNVVGLGVELQRRAGCNHDNCLRALEHNGAQASSFCVDILDNLFTP